jgi:hypothetical protein
MLGWQNLVASTMMRHGEKCALCWTTMPQKDQEIILGPNDGVSAVSNPTLLSDVRSLGVLWGCAPRNPNAAHTAGYMLSFGVIEVNSDSVDSCKLDELRTEGDFTGGFSARESLEGTSGEKTTPIFGSMRFHTSDTL